MASRRFRLSPWLSSLLFHAAIALLGLFWLRDFFGPPTPLTRAPIEVALKSSSGGGGGSAHSRARVTPRQVPPALDLGLAPKSIGHGSSEIPEGHRGNGKSAASGDDPFEEARTMDPREELKTYAFYRALWKKIDAAVDYPTELVKSRLTGVVSLTVEVTSRGVFTGKILARESDSIYLEPYVLALLVRALREPMPKGLENSDRKTVPVALRFDFRVFGVGEKPPANDFDLVKNVLFFARSGYVDPRWNEEIERIMTNYFPPIIPVPGGFYIDFVRAYQLIHNLGKPDAKELLARHVQLDLEQWQTLVHE
ncbi:MAG: hypothetical protein ACXWP5_07115 [Bdellovibrionota bacterium]